MGILIGIGIFYLVCLILSGIIFAYEVKHAPLVPQKIDIYDL